jgi:hypothetical protein
MHIWSFPETKVPPERWMVKFMENLIYKWMITGRIYPNDLGNLHIYPYITVISNTLLKHEPDPKPLATPFSLKHEHPDTGI